MDHKKIITPIIAIFLIGSAITLAQTTSQPLPRQSLIETKWQVDAKKQGNIKQGGAVGDGGLVAYRNSIELNIPLKKGPVTNLNQEGNDDSTSVAQRGIEKKDIRRGMVINGSQTKRESASNSNSTYLSTGTGYVKAKLQIINLEGENDYIIGIISKEGLSMDSISNLKLPSSQYFRDLFKSGENVVFLSFDQQGKNLKKIQEGGYIPGAGIVSARLAFIVIDEDLQKIFSDPEWWQQNKGWLENEIFNNESFANAHVIKCKSHYYSCCCYATTQSVTQIYGVSNERKIATVSNTEGGFSFKKGNQISSLEGNKDNVEQRQTPASCYKEKVNNLNREMQSRKKQALSEYQTALKSVTSTTAKIEARKTYNNKIKEINNWYNQQLNQAKIDCGLKKATTTDSIY